MDIQPTTFDCGCVISTVCGEVEHVACADPACMVKTELRRLVERMSTNPQGRSFLRAVFPLWLLKKNEESRSGLQ